MASAHHSSWIPLTREDSGHNLWRHASSSILVHSHSSASKKKVADQFTESPMSPRITSLGVPGSASSTGASRHGKSPHSSSTHQDKDSYMDMEMDIAEKTTGELSCSPAGATRRPTTRSRTVQMRTVQIRLCGVLVLVLRLVLVQRGVLEMWVRGTGRRVITTMSMTITMGMKLNMISIVLLTSNMAHIPVLVHVLPAHLLILKTPLLSSLFFLLRSHHVYIPYPLRTARPSSRVSVHAFHTARHYAAYPGADAVFVIGAGA